MENNQIDQAAPSAAKSKKTNFKYNPNAPFFLHLQDKGKMTSVNGSPMPMAVWNLIISIRDCRLYSKGIKPHRNWKISQVKDYFGIKGNASDLADQLEIIKDSIYSDIQRAEQ